MNVKPLLALPLLPVPLLLLPRPKRSLRKKKLMPLMVVWTCSVVEEEEETIKYLNLLQSTTHCCMSS
jgi:hypothetical protein